MTEADDKVKICDESIRAEISQLKKALAENNAQLIAMEAVCHQKRNRYIELEDSLVAWQDKYERLQEAHKRVEKTNENLEDKLLKLVDRSATERSQLTSDVASLSVRLAQANYNIGTLQQEIERYKSDMALAIQLLQCKPDNFLSQRVTSLPQNIQKKVSQYARLDTHSHSDSEGSTSGFGTLAGNEYHILPASDSPTFSCALKTQPYLNGTPNDRNCVDANEKMISPLGVAKYLDDKLKAANLKHCDTCSCPTRDMRVLADIDQTYSIGIQTTLQCINFELCTNCNTNWNLEFVNKHFLSTKSIDSSIESNDKCNAFKINSNEKIIGKKDELMVNPILGHTGGRAKPLPNQSNSSRSISSLSAKSGNAPSNDGSKIFQSFNRNLIKSIKAEKPNIHGPRLCALRIPNESKNILLDTIESESNPIIYTRRNRFLDEEFDEIRDTIVSSDSMCGEKDTNLKLNISMLMSDGVKTINFTDDKLIVEEKIENNFGEIERMKISSDTVAINSDLILCKMTDDYQNLKQDDSELLRQQQLNRVAEWVQMNTTIRQHNSDYGQASDAFSPSLSEYKIDDSSNNDEISDFSVDREIQSFSSINQINTLNNNSNSSGCIQMINRSSELIRSDVDKNCCNQTGIETNNNKVDLAQMEYNVKQFLLKQNEWSSSGPVYSDLT